ncbi:MAG: 4Fe-4S dicluster domain-containing protein [Gammaproteobacteria bacterium]|nr:4Fe-4S dicluster domain-containing protein [Gammaproteobacteria bacterium]
MSVTALEGKPAVAAGATASLGEVLRARIGENVFACYQCVKCTSGCPLAEEFDLTPNQVMRALQLNDAGVLASRAIWLCASCYSCATRCPRGIDVTGVMDALRIEARERGITAAVPEIPQFNRLFLRLTTWFGRVPELALMGLFNLRRGKPLQNAGLGWQLLRRGRLRLLPSFTRPARLVQPLAEPANKVGYFPGCASEGSAREYDATVRLVARTLELELVEPEGWTCCGSSPAHATDTARARAMPLTTLGTVERMGLTTLTSPCSSCFARLKHAEHAAARTGAAVLEAASGAAAGPGEDYRGTVRVQHLLDTLMERVGMDGIAGRVERPLTGLKVACYYGCLITRPVKVTGAEHHEYPMKMDDLLQALGAEPVGWSAKTDCCGGALGVVKTDVSVRLARRVLADARASAADLVVTMCPMCHLNLDARQQRMGFEVPTPIVHATQLMVLAFDLGEQAALLDRNIVDPRPLLRERGILAH